MSSLTEMLECLELDPRWVKYGYVDEDFLAEQCAAWRQAEDDDDSLEHYRIAVYALFCSKFEGVPIPNDDLTRYLELVECETDPPLRSWAISCVTERVPLTRDQFLLLGQHKLVAGTKHASFLERNRLDHIARGLLDATDV